MVKQTCRRSGHGLCCCSIYTKVRTRLFNLLHRCNASRHHIRSYQSAPKPKMGSSVAIQEHDGILKRKGTDDADWQDCRGWEKGEGRRSGFHAWIGQTRFCFYHIRWDISLISDFYASGILWGVADKVVVSPGSREWIIPAKKELEKHFILII